MAASQIHLVRHGEVHNPTGVLYGRLPGFHLSELGQKMAAAAADELVGHPITALYASPLLRAQESAKPWSEKFQLPIQTDERLIEPTNKFEGGTYEFGPGVLLHPKVWPWLMNPMKPSWGEPPYVSVTERMFAAIDEAWAAAESGEVVMVSHQMPIVMVQRAVAGKRPFHDPRARRCHLSSITTLERRGDSYVEVGYQDPASELLAQAIDTGAVSRARVLVAGVALTLALAGCTSSTGLDDTNSADSGSTYTDDSGQPILVAQDARGKALDFTDKTEDGSALTLSDYRGKVVVVNFWYSSCAPCRAEAPILQGLYQTYQDQDVAFIGVNTVDQPDTAISFEKGHGVTYPSVMDVDTGTARIAFSGAVSASVVPVTFVLDTKGRIAARIVGELQSKSILNTLITQTVAEK